MNEKPEEEVKKKCLKRLSQWQSWGVVVDVDDVSDLGRRSIRGHWVMTTEKGKRDIIVLFKVQSFLWAYLIECKAPDGGTWNEHQQNYAKKFEGLENCIYEVVSDPKQIDITLDRITNRTELLLQEADAVMNKNYPTMKCEEETF